MVEDLLQLLFKQLLSTYRLATHPIKFLAHFDDMVITHRAIFLAALET
jgi:hypothetical protein